MLNSCPSCKLMNAISKTFSLHRSFWLTGENLFKAQCIPPDMDC
jgi:hypothetical protein